MSVRTGQIILSAAGLKEQRDCAEPFYLTWGELLADGEVLGCVSTRPDPMRGCAAERLGVMPYLCAAAPAFRARWFPRGLTHSALGLVLIPPCPRPPPL